MWGGKCPYIRGRIRGHVTGGARGRYRSVGCLPVF